ncbi:hypothetical protein JCGZ_09626 [Jatropha curcas]|uniref:Aldehyde dehydrogenase domain-containing protein n=1 Tax=Jatropha curcas TaxID=180498 RepID=A0A067LAF4_JATCU|nr:hypothetical protein JCGZ_09626 [Jatropha curcas]
MATRKLSSSFPFSASFGNWERVIRNVIRHVAEGDAEGIKRAVSAARKAFDEGPWPKIAPYERSCILYRSADLIEKNIDKVSALKLGTAENLMIRLLMLEVPKHMIRYYAGWLPPGVLNVVSGFGPTAGASLCSHMGVDKIAFTGSTETGKKILEMAAMSNLKSVTLELGGKSPFIICEDADIDQAVELADFALFFNQIDETQFKKILTYIISGVESGATLEIGGDRCGSKGYYVQPTIFSNVKDNMLIAQDEIFGPVQTILKYKDLDEVAQRANASRFGLAAGVFTPNMDTANTSTRALRVGSVWINCYDIFDAAIPFGGYKMSSQGREKGIYGLSNYLQIKAVVTPLYKLAWL